MNKTPLYAEDMITMLKDCVTVAGYNGSCEKVISYNQFIKKLNEHIEKSKVKISLNQPYKMLDTE